MPGPGLERLWRRYEQFEQGASKGPLGRRILDEQRPKYQAAREAARERAALLSRVDMRALALPPGEGASRLSSPNRVLPHNSYPVYQIPQTHAVTKEMICSPWPCHIEKSPENSSASC